MLKINKISVIFPPLFLFVLPGEDKSLYLSFSIRSIRNHIYVGQNVLIFKLNFFNIGPGILAVGQYMHGIIHSSLICALFDMESHPIYSSFSVLF